MLNINKYNVLLIDDHPLIMEAYQSALFFLSSLNEDIEFEISSANNCELALEKIKWSSHKKIGYDIIFLDMSLPPSVEDNIFTGEDLGLIIRNLLPKTKIIVITAFSDNLKIQSILKNINPEGLLIKNDLTPKELVNAIQIILTDKSYYSETVMQLLRKQVISNISVDRIDRQLLYELSLGTRMKELSGLLPLSLAGIEKRKQRLMELFEIESRLDRDLVLRAREKGFI